MINRVTINNFLSFDDNGVDIELQPLNVIIGTNGSGKSNFLEAFDLLKNAPSSISRTIREGGGVSDWLYKGGDDTKKANLAFEVENHVKSPRHQVLRYTLSFDTLANKFEIVDEKIVNAKPDKNEIQPYTYYDFLNGNPTINISDIDEKSVGRQRHLNREEVDVTKSILEQKRDIVLYPEITQLAAEFSKLRLYRDWTFGRYSPSRLPQKADLQNQYLESDCSNLCLVLSEISLNTRAKRKLIQELKLFYHDVEDYEIHTSDSSAQIFFHETGLRTAVPATRLSDGTLRYLCLLAILFHPTPPPLVCIEEPELGMHPDILPNLGKLLREASEHTQLIITTHSANLVDSFTDIPESVIVAEKQGGGTQLNRLEQAQLAHWLQNYQLGDLWMRGDIGGTRW
jgi:predicted ATPase